VKSEEVKGKSEEVEVGNERRETSGFGDGGRAWHNLPSPTLRRLTAILKDGSREQRSNGQVSWKGEPRIEWLALRQVGGNMLY